MSLALAINYDNAGNFDEDANFVEFAGSLVRLRDLTANISFGALFSSSIDGSYGLGSLTGTLGGAATVAAGVLNCNGGVVAYGRWAGAGNFPGTTQWAARWTYTPNYSGSPAANRVLFYAGALAAIANRGGVVHTSGGGIQLVFDNNLGSNIFNYTGPAWVPTSGVSYEFEMNFDVLTGASRLFIDGVQYGVTQTATGTRTTPSEFWLGTDRLQTATANGTFDNLLIFDSVQHTSNYTPGAEVPATKPGYTQTNPTVTQSSGFEADALDDFAETLVSTPAGTALRYHFLVSGVATYWNGAAWVASDGSFAQSNSAADIIANKDALDLSSGVTLQLVSVLNSDGTATPSITTITVSYDFFKSPSALPNKCTLYGEEIFPDCDEIVGMTVRAIRSRGFFHSSGHYIGADIIEATSVLAGDRGYWELALVESATDGETYVFEKIYTKSDGSQITETFSDIEVPNQLSAAFADLQ